MFKCRTGIARAAAAAAVIAAAVSACGPRTAATVVPGSPAVPHAAVTKAAVASRSPQPPPAAGSAKAPPPPARPASPPAVSAAPPAAASSAPPAAGESPAGCYPLTDGGKCYQPGEYCREDRLAGRPVRQDCGLVRRTKRCPVCHWGGGWLSRAPLRVHAIAPTRISAYPSHKIEYRACGKRLPSGPLRQEGRRSGFRVDSADLRVPGCG
jgi:hypothetical protein